jgi:hypothetical protein
LWLEITNVRTSRDKILIQIHGYKMNAGGKVMFYSIVARNSGFISVLAHPLGVSGKTSALFIAELFC